VPTGGGKTLTSLGFALDHARVQSMDRIVYGIPFAGVWIDAASYNVRTMVVRDCGCDRATRHQPIRCGPEIRRSCFARCRSVVNGVIVAGGRFIMASAIFR
jgi:hypothetical protein